MKGIMMGVALGLCAMAHAEEVKLEYEKQPRAVHPAGLYQAGISGVVRVEFTAHHDGSITDIQVLQSSYREFAESAVRAVSRWRLKPWQVDASNPASIRVHQDIYFAAKGERRELSARMRSRIRSLTCYSINREVEYLRSRIPDEHAVEIPTFRHTLQMLARKAHREKLSFTAEQEIAGQFVSVMPGILGKCSENPELRYLDLLPEVIRERL
jgi:periplasmic protein TonB